ncbi:hypothetical protein IF1G_09823 [Cordyceps javanica]|uniref:Uncharacterized protein n=1 Tax=Cordyceps javanica TaxID=43265 RepID=A0A545UPD5_9HYPO|nr:hypothetical protein IF1G_09823 [Cordyceps javanica]
MELLEEAGLQPAALYRLTDGLPSSENNERRAWEDCAGSNGQDRLITNKGTEINCLLPIHIRMQCGLSQCSTSSSMNRAPSITPLCPRSSLCQAGPANPARPRIARLANPCLRQPMSFLERPPWSPLPGLLANPLPGPTARPGLA